MKKISVIVLCLSIIFLSGCQSTPPTYDYSKFNQSKPKSILVLPPINSTAEVKASNAFLSTVTKPLAEKGYYVFPVAIVEQFMRENGLHTPGEMHQAPLDKINQVFNADAVLYVLIKEWSTKYIVLSTFTHVNLDYRLVDAKTGDLLWDHNVNLKIDHNQGNGGGGLAGALAQALVSKIASAMVDYETPAARQANYHAFYNQHIGLLDGSRKLAKENK